MFTPSFPVVIGFDGDLLLELVEEIAAHVSLELRCGGECTNHVKSLRIASRISRILDLHRHASTISRDGAMYLPK